MKVTALAGGVGGAKLLVGLQRVDGRPDRDRQHRRRCVDLRRSRLARCRHRHLLAGRDRRHDHAVGASRETPSTSSTRSGRLGTETWFRLGDRDLATCLFRTERLRAGATLSAATDDDPDGPGGSDQDPADDRRPRVHAHRDDRREDARVPGVLRRNGRSRRSRDPVRRHQRTRSRRPASSRRSKTPTRSSCARPTRSSRSVRSSPSRRSGMRCRFIRR